jgi:hypothetical protein
MLDFNEVEQELKKMKPRQRLYELVKNEMKRRGHWKPKARGIVFTKGYDPRRGEIKSAGGNNREEAEPRQDKHSTDMHTDIRLFRRKR